MRTLQHELVHALQDCNNGLHTKSFKKLGISYSNYTKNLVDTYYSKIGDGDWTDSNMGRLIGGLVDDTDYSYCSSDCDWAHSPSASRYASKASIC